MKANWSVIPDYEDIDRYMSLCRDYGVAFEYNDFFWPRIYEDKEETERRISFYNGLDRDTGKDTLHGVFYDIAMLSMDTVIRERSRMLVEKSLEIAKRLSCKGVVYHTGRLSGLDTEEYNNSWLEGMDAYLHELAGKHSDIEIYMENTFEKTPEPFVELMNRTKDLKNVKVCLDYAHLMLTPTGGEVWLEKLSPYIGHFHLNDHDLAADLHLAVGDGKIDFEAFKRLMERYNMDSQILIEVNGYDKTKRSLDKLVLI